MFGQQFSNAGGSPFGAQAAPQTSVFGQTPSLFGGGGGGLFGQQQQQQQPQQQSSLFSQTQPQLNSFNFGSTAQTSTSLFGGKPAFGAQPTSSFGQATPGASCIQHSVHTYNFSFVRIYRHVAKMPPKVECLQLAHLGLPSDSRPHLSVKQ